MYSQAFRQTNKKWAECSFPGNPDNIYHFIFSSTMFWYVVVNVSPDSQPHSTPRSSPTTTLGGIQWYHLSVVETRNGSTNSHTSVGGATDRYTKDALNVDEDQLPSLYTVSKNSLGIHCPRNYAVFKWVDLHSFWIAIFFRPNELASGVIWSRRIKAKSATVAQ